MEPTSTVLMGKKNIAEPAVSPPQVRHLTDEDFTVAVVNAGAALCKENGATLWCHQTWLAGNSPYHWRLIPLGKSLISMVHIPGSHV